jgi:hemerythrin-like domain-containing protein
LLAGFTKGKAQMKTTAISQMTVEHRHIETVVKSLRDAAAALDQHRHLNVQKLRTVVEFLRIYADHRHHQREETMFFPLLVKRGVPPQGCPIGGLNHEHEKGRALISALDEWITFYEQQQRGADVELRQTLQAIAALYQKHLWMEDAMVFPMAERLITVTDDEELQNQFAALDRKIGVETIQRLEKFAESFLFQTGAIAPDRSESAVPSTTRQAALS